MNNKVTRLKKGFNIQIEGSPVSEINSKFKSSSFAVKPTDYKGIAPICKGSPTLTLTLHKPLVQKRYARSISGHQETLVHFQDIFQGLTVCSICFHP